MTVSIARPMNRRRPAAPAPRRPATPQPPSRMQAKLRERIAWHEQRIEAGGDVDTHTGAIRQLRQAVGDPLPEPAHPRAEVARSETPPAEPERRPPPPMHRVVEAKPSPARVVRAETDKEQR